MKMYRFQVTYDFVNLKLDRLISLFEGVASGVEKELITEVLMKHSGAPIHRSSVTLEDADLGSSSSRP